MKPAFPNTMKTKLLVRLLALLGFSAALPACEGMGQDEYGCPWAEFSLKGKVTDARNNPIPGIRVEMSSKSGNAYVLTDIDGLYVLDYGSVNRLVGGITVTAADTDGPDNGGDFESRTETLSITDDDYTGAGGWFQGKAEAKLDFMLEPKTDPAER